MDPVTLAIVGAILFVTAAGVIGWRRERDRAVRALAVSRHLEALAEAISAETDPDAVLRTLASSALQLVDADYVTVAVKLGELFEIRAGAGLGERVLGIRAPVTTGILGAVLRARQTVAVPEYGGLGTTVGLVREIGIRPMIGVPIFVHGELTACLSVGRVAARPFSADDRDVLDALAGHAAIAVRNARLIEQARRLESLSRALATDADPEAVLARTAEEAAAALGVDYLVLAEVGRDRGVLRASVVRAAPLAGRASLPMGPLLEQVFERRGIVTVEDYARTHSRVAEGEGALGLHATMAAPIVIDGTVVAVLIASTTDEHRSFQGFDRQAIASFADAAATALRAAASRRDRDRRLGRHASLNDLAAKLALAHEPAEIARLATEAVRALAPGDSCTLDLEVDPSSDVMRTGEPVVMGSTVQVPLRIRGAVMGVLSVQGDGRIHDDEDVALLRSLANLVAAALENAQHLARMRELYLASVRALAAAVDARDPYTRSHSARVAALSRTIAEELALSPDETRRVQLGALLHDIGKIGIPDAILNKPAALNDEEWVVMRTHAALGGSILAAVEPLRDLVPIVRAHHERFDGTGYPDGLRGDQIPLAAYIVAAADAYEVIVSRRSYKAAQTVDFALTELRRCSGQQFHPTVVDAFVRVIERDRREGAGALKRIEAIREEDIEDVPGPGAVVERIAATSHSRARQLEVLQRLAGEITAVLDVNELSDRLLRIVCDTMGYENGFLSTVDEDASRLVIRAAVGPSIDYVGQTLPRGTGISWWVVDHGRPQNVRDVLADTRFVGPGAIRSSLIVPLRMDEERIGVLGVESTRVGAFDAADEELLTAVSHQVAAAMRVARLHQAAKVAAATDPLTGLPNRREFFDRLQAGLLRNAASDAPLSVAIVDVNRLKELNDRLGHLAGDEALVRIGELLAIGVRAEDSVARCGGDEFGIVFPGATLLAAERIMRRLADLVGSATLAGGGALPTIAWGVASASPLLTTPDALVDAADRAMYRHKQGGRRATTA